MHPSAYRKKIGARRKSQPVENTRTRECRLMRKRLYHELIPRWNQLGGPRVFARIAAQQEREDTYHRRFTLHVTFSEQNGRFKYKLPVTSYPTSGKYGVMWKNAPHKKRRVVHAFKSSKFVTIFRRTFTDIKSYVRSPTGRGDKVNPQMVYRVWWNMTPYSIDYPRDKDGKIASDLIVKHHYVVGYNAHHWLVNPVVDDEAYAALSELVAWYTNAIKTLERLIESGDPFFTVKVKQ